MPITKDVNNVIQYSLKKDTWESDFTGVEVASQFIIADDTDVLKQLRFDTSALPTNTQIILSPPSISGTIALAGGGSTPSFVTIQTPSGTSPVATGPTDTLTLAQGANITITGDSSTDTVTFAVSGLTKSDVGLGNVDNTSDATKNAAVATLTNKTLTAPVINSPTGIVKGDVGLGNVDNTSDANKPISTATQTALNLKASVAVVDIYTASNTWTKRTGATYIEVLAMGPGSGGGAGATTPLGTACSGGAAGSGGGATRRTFVAADLGATETVTIGAASTGAVGSAAASGASSSTGGSVTFGVFVAALGGAGATGGRSAAAAAAGIGGTGNFSGTGGVGGGGVNGAAGAAPAPMQSLGGGQGGGAGGGISTTPVAFAGGSVISPSSANVTTKTGGAINSNGVAGSSLGQLSSGQGGSGAGGSITTTGGNGGAGGGLVAEG